MKIVPAAHDQYILTEVPVSRSTVEKLQTYREEDWPRIAMLALMTGMALVGRPGPNHPGEVRPGPAKDAEVVYSVPPAADMRRYLEDGFRHMLSGWEERIVRDFETLLADLGERR